MYPIMNSSMYSSMFSIKKIVLIRKITKYKFISSNHDRSS